MGLAVAAGFLLLVVFLLLFFQRSLIYLPRRYEPIDLKGLPPGAAMLDYETQAGKQFAYYLPPIRQPAKVEPQRLWLVFGGNAMRALDWLDFIEMARRPGTAFLLVDYPGYGQSEGRPSRAAIGESAEGAFQALSRFLNVPPSQLEPKLNILGLSIGAAVGLDFARTHAPTRIVLLAPFTTLLAMARRTLGVPLCYLLYDRFDNRARLTELTRRPKPPEISLFHGTSDEIVPFQMGQELAAIAPQIISFHPVQTAGHNTLLETGQQAILKAISD